MDETVSEADLLVPRPSARKKPKTAVKAAKASPKPKKAESGKGPAARSGKGALRQEATFDDREFELWAPEDPQLPKEMPKVRHCVWQATTANNSRVALTGGLRARAGRKKETRN